MKGSAHARSQSALLALAWDPISVWTERTRYHVTGQCPAWAGALWAARSMMRWNYWPRALLNTRPLTS